jgi:hypothetical protein
MKRDIVLFSLVVLLLVSGSALGVERVGTTAFQVLKLNVGARGAGMGNAMVAGASEATSVFWNPSGLAWSAARDIRLLHVNLPADVNYDGMCFAYRLPGEWGTLGVGLSLLHMDDMIVRTAEDPRPEDRAGDDVPYFTAWDMVAVLSYGRALTDRFSFGGSIKYIREFVNMPSPRAGEDPWLDDYAADGVNFDAGLQYQTGFRSLRMGMVIQNFGPDTRFGGSFLDYRLAGGTATEPEETDFADAQQPLTFKAGVTADLATMTGYSLGSNLSGCMSAQFEHPNDHSERVNMGVELWYHEMLAVRGGYNLNYDADRFTLGFGVRVPWAGERTLHFDYAYADQGDLTDTSAFLNQPHRFGIGFEF